MSLIVDTLALDAARIDVARIHDEFVEAADRGDRLADAVGHARLADRIRSFTDSWKQHRREMAADLAVVRDDLATIVEGFASTDRDLANALTQERADYPPRTAPEPT